MSNQNTEVEEDFLEVDNSINGQKYVLLSFVTPEKVLKRKELFTFHKYLKHKDENYELTHDKFVEDYKNFIKTFNTDSSLLTNQPCFQVSISDLKAGFLF